MLLCSGVPPLIHFLPQTQILGASEHIRSKLKTCGNMGDPDLRWRDSDTYFQPGKNWPPGVWLASPGGYAVGHKVGTALYEHKPCGDSHMLYSPERSTLHPVGASEHWKAESGR